MIAAVLGPSSPAEIETLIRRIAGRDPEGRVRLLRFERGALCADASVPRGHLDEAAGIAWVGAVRGLDGLESRPRALKGDFAAVARGPHDDQLIVARGRFGGRPLYFSWVASPAGRALVVASRLESLLAAFPVPPPLDVDKLAASLVGGVPEEHGRTHYQGIHRVPSATILRVDERDVLSSVSLDLPPAPPRSAHADVLADELRERLLSSVARAIDGASRIGVFASGGVDSSAILAAALAVTRGKPVQVEALNIEFSAEGDDRHHFEALCAALGVAPIRIPPEDGGAHWRRSLVIDRAPYPYGSQIGCMIRLAELARERGSLDLVLTGDGGDAMFDGDLRVFAERARHGELARALRAAWALEALGRSTPRLRVDHLVLRPLIRSVLPSFLRRAWRARHTRPPPWAGPVLRSFMRDRADSFEIEPEEEAPTGTAKMARLSRAGLMLDLRDMRAQLEIAMGCACADPLYDEDLAEFVASVPPETLFHGGRKRGLFRHALRGLIPESVRLRKDKSFFEPALTRAIRATGGFESLRALAHVDGLADLGLVEPREFLGDFEQLARTPENGRLWAMLWPVLCAESFVRGHRGSVPS